MFDWIWQGGAAFFIAWNYWSIVPVFIIAVLAMVIWKTAVTPKEYQERLAWEQQKENQRLTQARINRIGTMCLKWVVLLMGSIFFCISMYKMYQG